MKEGAEREGTACERTTLVAAYLDDDLDPASAARFEGHARECPQCSTVLLEQRRLLCLLDAAFNETFETRVPLPRDFTRAVKARAQTDMSGVRDRRERVRAVKICVALSAASLALLGVAAFGPLLSAARTAGSLLGAAGRTASDAGAGAGVILRAAGGGPSALTLFLLAVCVVALLLLWRLISSYHRARD
jgi:anti-sigma factor RsiW